MQCTSYLPDDWRTRCPGEAVYALIGPDGAPNPGTRLCVEHALGVIDEYRTKLGENWWVRPLEERP